MNHLKAIEWLRGVAALGVCQMHIFCTYDFFTKDDKFFQKFIFPLSIAGRTGVAIFFVISGFIIPYSMSKNRYQLKQFGLFMVRRLARLEPPYIFSIVLALLVMTGVGIFLNKPVNFDWENIFLHLGYLNVFFGQNWLVGVY